MNTLAVVLTSFFLSHAHANPGGTHLSGQIFNSATEAPILSPDVDFVVKVLSPGGCLLYSEQHLNKDLQTSRGSFDIDIGTGTSAYNAYDSSSPQDKSALVKVFDNQAAAIASGLNAADPGDCPSSAYAPASGDYRQVRIEFNANDGNGPQIIAPYHKITNVPYALLADKAREAKVLDGKLASDFVQITDLPTVVPAYETDSSVKAFAKADLPACGLNEVLKSSGGTLSCVPDQSGGVPSPATTTSTGVVQIGSGLSVNGAGLVSADSAAIKASMALGIPDITGLQTALGDKVPYSQIPSCTASQIWTFVSPVGGFSCTPIAVTAAQVADFSTAVDARIAASGAKLPLAGGIMAGSINMDNNHVTNTGYITMNPGMSLHLSNNAADPAGLVASDKGKVWFNSTSNSIKYWDGTQAKQLASGVPTCAANQYLTYDGTSWSCVTDAGSSGTITSVTVNHPLKNNGTANAPIIDLQFDNTQFDLNSNHLHLKDTGVSAGTYSSVTVDAAGRVTGGTNPTTLAGHGITDAVQNAGGTPSVLSDVVANRPAAGTNGRIFIASDEKKIYRDNGTTWDVLSAAATSGTVTSITAGAGLTGGTITSSGTIAVDVGTGNNQIVQLDGSARLPAVNGSQLTNVTGSANKLLTKSLDATTPTTHGQIYQYDSVQDKFVLSKAQVPTNGQVLKWNDTNKQWEPGSDAGGWTAVDATTSVKGIMQIGAGLSDGGAGVVNVDASTLGVANKIQQLDGSGVATSIGLAVKGSTAGTATIQSPNSFTNYTLTLPADDGNNGQVLSTNGSGVLSWANASTGSQWTTAASDIYYNTGNVGIGTVSPEAKLTLDNDGSIVAKGVDGAGAVLTTSGAGSRMIWYPRKSAFRAGAVNGSGRWDNANIGEYSAAFGWNTLASGDNSFAAGDNSTASGMYSISMGTANQATQEGAIALGNGNTSNGQYSFSVGTDNVASGTYASAIGTGVTAESYSQITVGTFNMPQGTEDANVRVATDPLFVVGNGTGAGAGRSNAMMILKNGNVGVGMTAPVATLDVNGILRMGSGTCNGASIGSLQLNSTTHQTEICTDIGWVASTDILIPASTRLVIDPACPAGWTDLGGAAGGQGAGPSGTTTDIRLCESPATPSAIPAGTVVTMQGCPAGWTTVTTSTGSQANTSYGTTTFCQSPSKPVGLPPGARVMAASCPANWANLGSTLGAQGSWGGQQGKLCEVPGASTAVGYVAGSSAGSSSRSGGGLILRGGTAGTAGGTGGSVSISGGTPFEGNGGGISINSATGVTATSTARNGGNISITAGNGVSGGTGGGLSLQTGNNGSGVYSHLTLQSTGGNVGIGIAIPAYKLDVAGDVNVTGSFKVNGVDISNGSSLDASNLSSGTIPTARMPALTGDVSMSVGTTTTSVDKIKGKTVAAVAYSAGQVLRYDGTNWVNNFVAITDLRSTVTGSSSFASSCAANQTLVYNSVGDVMTCANISLPATQVTGTLPVANGGTGTTNGSITGTGALTFAAGGTNQNVTLTPSGTGTTTLNGEVVISKNNVTDGAACPNDGAIARDAAGDLYICK